MRVRILTLTIFILLITLPVQAERVSVLATIKGTSPLKISGTGIVEGLNGTGDKAVASRKALKTLLAKENINVSMSDIEGQNVAIVSVTAEIPAFTRPGTMIDVTVASLFDAKNLENGILKLTQLRVQPNGETYAVASGRVNVGGESSGNQFPTTASITGGAQVVRAHEVNFLSDRSTFELLLKEPSFATAQAIAYAINSTSGTNPRLDSYLEEAGFAAFDKPVPGYAQALNAGTVIVQIPDYYMMDKVKFISAVMKDVNVDVDIPPRVVFDRATNTIVITGEVRVGSAAIAHGDLTVNVERPEAEAGRVRFLQPKQETRSLVELSEAAQGQSENLRSLLNTLNAMKARPRDIIAIFENLKRAGALHAEIVVR